MAYIEHDVFNDYLRELLEWSEHVQHVIQSYTSDEEKAPFRYSQDDPGQAIGELIHEIKQAQLSVDKGHNRDYMFSLYQRAQHLYESSKRMWGLSTSSVAEKAKAQVHLREDSPWKDESAAALGREQQTTQTGGERPVPIGGHRLPPLPYAYNALEPYIDEEIMRLHHQKHHQSYVDGLNRAEKKMAEARRTGNFELIRHWEREAAFHGSGHYLHTIFWNNMSPQGGGEPSGELARQIRQDFGGFRQFKKHFSEAAKEVEGVGWALLVWSPRSHRLEILAAEKHQHFAQWDVIPLLVLDVWEHAYYLQYKNNRGKYVDQWWNVVNWPDVAARYQEARKLRWTPF
ncbi:Fe-Mn family superoxide dismutase [Caldalkalibacillus uzonensis]|uniref:superoxide dismutase n=2 Tax=Caldalkalibacillus uzonensis TaxID=353224 RepID=A0ABU0CMZ8_9BACI|nr:superoxide dismutase [Caldalkalibacillus uzonensis]MDQ0337795.1 Fe-Mn family superoxide dismutase [Caldalkalibacillus uzonensis]